MGSRHREREGRGKRRGEQHVLLAHLVLLLLNPSQMFSYHSPLFITSLLSPHPATQYPLPFIPPSPSSHFFPSHVSEALPSIYFLSSAISDLPCLASPATQPHPLLLPHTVMGAGFLRGEQGFFLQFLSHFSHFFFSLAAEF